MSEEPLDLWCEFARSLSFLPPKTGLWGLWCIRYLAVPFVCQQRQYVWLEKQFSIKVLLCF